MNFYIPMFIGFRFFLGKFNFFFNKLVTVLSIISITIGVSSIIIIISIMNGCEDTFKNKVLKFIPHIIVTNNQDNINSSNHIKNIITNKYIKDVSEIVTSDVLLQSKYAFSTGIALGVKLNTQYKYLLKHFLINQNLLNKLIQSPYTSIIGKNLAEQLNLNLGDTFYIASSKFHQISMFGNIPSKKMFKLIGTFSVSNEIDSYQVLVNQDDLSKFLHHPKNYITGWRLWLFNPLSIKKFLNDIPHFYNIKFRDWRETKGELFQAIEIEQYMMVFLFSLIIIKAIFSLTTSISMMIMEKERDIAIFQTLGLSKFKIIMIFIIQGLINGIIGTLLGTILSFLCLNKEHGLLSIISIFFGNVSLPILIIPFQIVLINLITLILIIAFILYPAFKIVSVNPVKRLFYE